MPRTARPRPNRHTDELCESTALGESERNIRFNCSYYRTRFVGEPRDKICDIANHRNFTRITSDISVRPMLLRARQISVRSEEHTSELQSLRHLVCRLLLEKKKKN